MEVTVRSVDDNQGETAAVGVAIKDASGCPRMRGPSGYKDSQIEKDGCTTNVSLTRCLSPSTSG